jgi:hypothetical protein
MDIDRLMAGVRRDIQKIADEAIEAAVQEEVRKIKEQDPNAKVTVTIKWVGPDGEPCSPPGSM